MTSIVRGSAVDVLARSMSEGQLQASITEMLDTFRIRWHHETDSRRSKSGLPDLIIVGRRVEWWELKKQGGRVSPEQNEWLTSLIRAGAKARVVRPLDLLNGSVQTWLRSLR